MTTTTFSEDDAHDASSTADTSDTERASRQWRSVWRIHFYSGVFAFPFLLLMAVTGLFILYTQPIQDALQGDLRTVAARGTVRSYDEQEQAVEAEFPGKPVLTMTTPVDSEHSTIFAIDDGSAAGIDVFVDPYTAEVLGSDKPGSGIVGLSNRLHGYLNNEAATIQLPTVSALWDDGDLLREYVIGDLVLEILGVWTLVLVVSGLYLWWPRTSRWKSRSRNGRGLFGLRMRKRGRARWRDMHAMSGLAMFIMMIVTLISGLAWSTYWGPNFTAFANEITPNTWTDAPQSSLGTRGDLDRLGNTIPWNTGDRPIPASYATAADGTLPAPISLDTVVAIAEEEGMQSGYYVTFPTNAEDEAGNPVYGSFMVSNSWPRKTEEARDIFLDQFTGKTLAEQEVYGYGAISYGVDFLVSVHMGTQFGLVTRILMTGVCLLAIFSSISAFIMFWKRRGSGASGLPRRPVNVRLEKRLWVFLAVFMVAFPLWGVSALIVLTLDRFVIRKIRPLRVAFGQR